MLVILHIFICNSNYIKTMINMKKTLILCAMAALSVAAGAQTACKLTVNLTPDGASNLQVFLPETPTGRAIVGCPGGGYSHLSMQNEGTDWAEYFNRQGIAYCVLTYRMPKGDRTLPMTDAQNAIRTVRDSARAWRVNPYDVGIMGFSAGGHLASTTATHAPAEARPDFQILFYPVISMDERVTHKGSVVGFLGDGRRDKALVDEYSNDKQVRSHQTPPAFLVMAGDDSAVPPLTNGLPYYTALRRAGIPASLHIYPAGGHGFGFRTSFAYHDQMLGELSAWLKSIKAPAADARRVACVGNSITFGYGIDMSDVQAYPAQLQRLLGPGYCVRNFGVSARTMLNHGDRPYMKEKAWAEAKAFCPDIVVVKLGTNDSKPRNWDKCGKEFAADLQQMVDELKALPSKPAIYLCCPVASDQSRTTAGDNQIRDSVVVAGIIPAIKKVAKKNKLTVIDLHPLLDAKSDQMQRDGIHPTAKGAAVIAKAVAEAVAAGKR